MRIKTYITVSVSQLLFSRRNVTGFRASVVEAGIIEGSGQADDIIGNSLTTTVKCCAIVLRKVTYLGG